MRHGRQVTNTLYAPEWRSDAPLLQPVGPGDPPRRPAACRRGCWRVPGLPVPW